MSCVTHTTSMLNIQNIFGKNAFTFKWEHLNFTIIILFQINSVVKNLEFLKFNCSNNVILTFKNYNTKLHIFSLLTTKDKWDIYL
jgi:hypothetical protein